MKIIQPKASSIIPFGIQDNCRYMITFVILFRYTPNNSKYEGYIPISGVMKQKTAHQTAPEKTCSCRLALRNSRVTVFLWYLESDVLNIVFFVQYACFFSKQTFYATEALTTLPGLDIMRPVQTIPL